MADTNRHLFGGSIADYAVTLGTTDDDEALALVPGAVVTFWNQQVGGSQYDDLSAGPDGTGPTDQTTSSDGTDGWPVGELVPVYGPPGIKGMWAEADAGARVWVECVDLGDTVDDLISRVEALEPAAALLTPFVFSVSGDLAVMAGRHHLINDSGGDRSISTVRAHVGTAPTGAAVQVDVKVNGATIFASAGDRPTVPAGGNDGVSGAISNPTWGAGQDITVSITSVGSGTPGADLTVAIWMV